jgi:DNA-binding response OmpR family regulator
MAEDMQDLNGKRIIVVEDDYLLATDVCRELRNLGATVLGPAPTPYYAMQLLGRKKIDAAVLDVRLHGTSVFEVAEMLQDRGVPIMFATASGRESLPGRFQGTPLLEKPLDRTKLISEIVALTRRPAAVIAKIVHMATPMANVEFPAQAFARALVQRKRAL